MDKCGLEQALLLEVVVKREKELETEKEKINWENVGGSNVMTQT